MPLIVDRADKLQLPKYLRWSQDSLSEKTIIADTILRSATQLLLTDNHRRDDLCRLTDNQFAGKSFAVDDGVAVHAHGSLVGG